MPSEGYVRQVLWQAVDCLATGDGPLRQRLVYAGLDLVKLKPDDFPDADGRAAFTAIYDTLTSNEPRGDEGSIEATTSRMSDDQARAVAKKIFSLDTKYRPMSSS